MTFEEADALYPYDPAYRDRAELFTGPEKLRAFDSPTMRRAVFLAMTDLSQRKPVTPDPNFVPWDKRPQSRAYIDHHGEDRRAGSDE